MSLPLGPDQKFETQEVTTRIAQLTQWAGDRGTSVAAVATAWLMHQNGVNAPIAGPSTRAHFDTLCAAVALELAPGDLRQLDELMPPG